MAPLGERIIVAFGALIIFGWAGLVCLTQPEVVQRWIVAESSKMGFFPFRRYVSSPAYINHLRFVGLGAAVGFLGLLFVFLSLLTKL
jgi:hypothetical protein